MAFKSNILILEGEEYFLRKKKLSEIVSDLLEGGFSDFNYIKLDGKKIDLREVVSQWQELPFGGSLRVVHIEDFDKLKVKKEDKAAKIMIKLARERTVKKNFLVLECDRFDKKGFNKEILPYAEVFSFKKVREWEFPAKIVQYAQNKGFSIDRHAVEMLSSSFSELMTLYSELEKLFSYKKSDKHLTVQDVRDVLFPSRDYTLFDLQDAILNRDLKNLLFVGSKLLDSGISYSSISGFLESTFKKAYEITYIEKPSSMGFYQKKLYSFGSLFGKSGIEKALIVIYKVLNLARRGGLSERVYLGYLFTHLYKISGGRK